MSNKPDPEHIVDQSMAIYRDVLGKAPAILRQFYNDLKSHGFDDAQSLSLTKTALIRVLGGNG